MGEDFVDDPDVPPLEFVPAATSTWLQKWLYTTMCSPSLFSSFRHSFNCSFRKKRRKKKRKKKIQLLFPAASGSSRRAGRKYSVFFPSGACSTEEWLSRKSFLQFDVNGLGTRCSFVSRFSSFSVFSRSRLNHVARK